MYISFDQLPDNSRIWIYQGDKKIESPELEKVEKLCRDFVNQWTAHQTHLEASYFISDNQFIVLAVNETAHQASGCSIDTSTNFIKSLAPITGVDFLNRQVVFEKNSQRYSLTMPQIKSFIADGKLDNSWLYRNNLIQTKGELEKLWLIPVTEGWMNRYFKE